MANKQIIITKGDYGIAIDAQFLKPDKSVQPITGCTVVIDIVDSNGAILNRTGQITDSANGLYTYVLGEEDTLSTGLYTMYIKLLDVSSNTTAQNTITYYVQDFDGGVV